MDRRYITSTTHGGFARLPNDKILGEFDRLLATENFSKLNSSIDQLSKKNKIPSIKLEDYIKRVTVLYPEKYKLWRECLGRYSRYRDLEKQLDIILPLNNFMLLRIEQAFASRDFDTFDRIAESLEMSCDLIFQDLLKLLEFKFNNQLMEYLKIRGYID